MQGQRETQRLQWDGTVASRLAQGSSAQGSISNNPLQSQRHIDMALAVVMCHNARQLST
jgi:hypothetical protein